MAREHYSAEFRRQGDGREPALRNLQRPLARRSARLERWARLGDHAAAERGLEKGGESRSPMARMARMSRRRPAATICAAAASPSAQA